MTIDSKNFASVSPAIRDEWMTVWTESAEQLDEGVVVHAVVDDEGYQEGAPCRHEMRAIDRQLPFQAEIALSSSTSVGRDQRDEERAGFDLPANRRIPGIPAPQLALVEPHFDARVP